MHQRYGKQHCEWYHGGHNKSRTEIPEKQHQHCYHDQCPFDQVSFNSTDSPLHQRASIQEPVNLQPFGQRLVHLHDLFFHARYYGIGVLSFQHQYDAANNFRLTVVCHGAVANRITESHFGYIANQYWYSLRRTFDDDLTDVRLRLNESFTPNEVGFRFLVDVGAASILIVELKRFEDVGDAKTVAAKFIRIECNLVLFEKTAEARNICYAFGAEQLSSYNPVLCGAQLHNTILFFVAFPRSKDVLEDLAETG